MNEPTFDGSYWAVRRLCQQWRRRREPEPGDVAIPVQTAPGQVAQVDFGYCGTLVDPRSGKLRRAWVFVMVLGHSRHLFAKVVFDQRQQTWLQLHAEAFAFFGGVPHVIVPDNLKAAVVRAVFGLGDKPSLNRSYCELARHYGFQIDPTPPYAPAKKGKVERAVKYVKRSFFAAWQPSTLQEANDGLQRWNAEVASVRRHGSTGRIPHEVFLDEEAPALTALPPRPYEIVIWKQAKVHRDAHVQFEGRLYSVPWHHLGKDVWVHADATTVTLYVHDERVATHDRRGEGPRSTLEAHLPEGRRELRNHSRAHWELRGLAMGDEVHQYVSALFEQDEVLLQLRTVQAVVTLLEKHPAHRARRACTRALRYANFTYRGVRDILRKGLDMEPDDDQVVLFGQLEAPRFARRPSDFRS